MSNQNFDQTYVTAAQMKKIEEKANENGLSYYQMMENAGTAAYHILRERFPAADSVIVLTGKGNNGGDGYVLARLALYDELRVLLIPVEGNPATEDAILNYGLLKNRSAKFLDSAFLDGVFRGIPGSLKKENTVIVDAIYGTGFHGELRAEGRKACSWINQTDCPVIALDVPSGVNADTAEADRDAVRADLTIAFHLPKPVHVKKEASLYCGEILVADIGIR